MDEVASLPAVLEDLSRPALLEGGAEQRGHARVRGMPGHARSVHVVEAQRGHDPNGLSTPDPRELLAVGLGRGVHIAGVQSCGLGNQPGDQRGSARGTGRLEPATRQVRRGARRRRHRPVVAAGVPPLAVDHHRGGVDDAGHAGFGGGPEHDGGAEIVLADVVVDVAELDPQPDLGGQVNDDLAARHRRSHPVEVGDVIARVSGPVEHDDVVAGRLEEVAHD